MTEDITRMLTGAVPEDSDPSSWGETARKRSQRRRTGQIAAVAALVVAVGIPIGLALTNPRQSAVPAQTPAPAPVSRTNPCASLTKAQADGNFRTPLDNGQLPDGAVQAWLCGDGAMEGFESGPAEPLTSGVGDLVAAFNALEPVPADQMCTEEYRYTYKIAVDYPNDQKVITGGLHGCRVVSDGVASRSGAEGFLATAIDLWREQRAAANPPQDAAAVCPPISSLIPASIDGVTQSYACTGLDGNITAKLLDADLTADIVAHYPKNLVDEVPGQGIAEAAALVLVDPWGSIITMRPLAGEGYIVLDTTADQPQFWIPSAELAQRIAEQFPKADPEQPSMDICTGALTPATTELGDFVQAYACVTQPDGGTRPQVVDTSTAWGVINQGDGLWEPFEGEPQTGQSLVLVNSNNEAHTLSYQADGSLVYYDANYQALRYQPDGEVGDSVKALFGG